MGVFAASALTFMLSAEFGGFWMTGMQIVLLVAGPVFCAYSMARSAGHVWLLGAWGWTRPRWWFELGNIAWIVVILGVSFLLVAGAFPPNWRAWLVPIEKPVLGAMAAAFLCAIVLSGVGYGLSLFYRRRPRGKAFACVTYFSAVIVVVGLGFVLVPQGAFVETIALAFLALAGVSALLAGAIALRQRGKTGDAAPACGTVPIFVSTKMGLSPWTQEPTPLTQKSVQAPACTPVPEDYRR